MVSSLVFHMLFYVLTQLSWLFIFIMSVIFLSLHIVMFQYSLKSCQLTSTNLTNGWRVFFYAHWVYIENELTVKAVESMRFIAVAQKQFSCKIGVELAYKKQPVYSCIAYNTLASNVHWSSNSLLGINESLYTEVNDYAILYKSHIFTYTLVCGCLPTSLAHRLKIIFYNNLQLNIRRAKYFVYFVPG